MSSRIDSMLSRAISIPGYTNPVAYDEKLFSRFGQWICRACESSWVSNEDQKHRGNCHIDADAILYDDSQLVFVVGINTTAIFSPFENDQMGKIKTVANQNLLLIAK
jgi:hypothetical protein